MKALFTLFLIGTSLFSYSHEGHQAFYNLRVENGTLVLESKLELPDLKSAVKNADACSEDQDFNWCASAWLVDKIDITINGKTRSLTLESSVTEDGHLILSHSLGSAPQTIEWIEVSNVAFLKYDHHYENILEIDISDEKQGFKMDQKRTSVSLKINQ